MEEVLLLVYMLLVHLAMFTTVIFNLEVSVLEALGVMEVKVIGTLEGCEHIRWFWRKRTNR
jgi:hypothetical protein